MIEISRTKSIYQYRQNPWNGRIIDRRVNKAHARWESFATYPTEEIARTNLLQLEARKKQKDAANVESDRRKD